MISVDITALAAETLGLEVIHVWTKGKGLIKK